MSAAKHIALEYCVLIAIQKNDNFSDQLEQALVKKYPHGFTNIEALREIANACSQKTCIVLTNDNVWLKNMMKQEFEKMKQGTFFIVSTDNRTFVPKGPLKKLVNNIIQPETPIMSIKNKLKFLKTGENQQKKMVTAFLKRKLQMELAPELENVAFLESLNKLLQLYYSNAELRTTFLAQKMGISQSTLERRCLKIKQKKPNQLLLEYRLAIAYKLSTETLLPFSSIAQQCGFGSASYFSVRFTDFYKIKPSQARLHARLKAS